MQTIEIPPTPAIEERVIGALRDCFDPELPVNIVDLGLVQSIYAEIDKEAPGADVPGLPQRFAVQVVLTMRTLDEERQPLLCGQVQNRLLGLREVSRAIVSLSFDPPWTPDRIKPNGRRQLGLDRETRSPLVQIRL